MKPVVPKPQRCAIYTRKSTEHNLDLEFNSLDAQREACETTADSREPPSIALPCKTSWLILGLARLPLWWSIRSTASRFMSRDWYRLPLLVRARQRGLKCIAICFALGLFLRFRSIPTPRSTDDADHRLPARIDVDVLDRDESRIGRTKRRRDSRLEFTPCYQVERP